MSRIGKVPVNVPDKVDVKITGHLVVVKGAKGELKHEISPLMKVELKNKQVLVNPKDLKAEGSKALWGTTRTVINNMLKGVHDGFTKSLEFTGVGYKAAVKGNIVTVNLGHSHPIDYTLPKGVTVKVDKNTIEVSGCDKELVGFVAATIRSFRPPEPYKGKGVRYSDERIIRKAGKTGAKKA